MPRRVFPLLIVLLAAVLVASGLSRLHPAAAAVGSASSQCAPLDASTASCSLSLDGSLVPGESITVALSAGAVSQVSYASGCQPSGALTPPALLSSASFTFTAPDGGCTGPVVFNETVGGLTPPDTLVQSVTDSGAPGMVINTAVFLVTLSGSKTCTAGATAGAFSCQLSVDASANMANATIGVAISNGVFTGAAFVSGCLNPPALSVSSTSFSFTTPAGGCGGFGPIVFSEAVAGVSGGSLTQTVSASGAYSGLAGITAQLPGQAGGAVALTGTKACGRANTSGGDDGDSGDDRAYADDDQAAGVTCTLTLQPSLPLAAGAMVTVQINGNAVFSAVNYSSGCAGAPAITVGGAGFSFAVPAGDCAGPLVLSESLSVTGAGGGPLAQTAIVSGASSGSATIVATRRNGSAFTLPSAQNGNGGDDDNGGNGQGNGNGGNGNGRGNGGGNGNGNGGDNGHNHSVPACQNSNGRAQQHNPHCQGGDD